MGTGRQRGHWLVSVPFLLVLVGWPSAAVAASGHEHQPVPAASHDTEHDHATTGHDDPEQHTTHDSGPDSGGEDGHGDHGATSTDEDRPLGLLLGGFGAINGAVLVAAAAVRRRNRATYEERQARRTTKRAVPPHRAGTR